MKNPVTKMPEPGHKYLTFPQFQPIDLSPNHVPQLKSNVEVQDLVEVDRTFGRR